MPEQLYYARRPFQYGNNIPADLLDVDQVFHLRGEPHDERLTRLGYCAPLSGRVTTVQCGLCGKQFITDASLNNHGRLRHADSKRSQIDARVVAPEQIAHETARGTALPADHLSAAEESEEASSERMLKAQGRDIYWNKTQAAIKEGRGTVEVNTQEPPKRKRGRPRKESTVAAGR